MDDPDDRFEFPPAACCGCGAGLAGAPVTASRRHQVTDIEPAPAPKVTEYVAQTKECQGCGTVTEGELPAHVRARASFGPETCAQAANLTAGHYIPVYRATVLLCQLAGVAVPAGWMAGIRGKAAGLVEAGGFMDRVRELLRAAPAVQRVVGCGGSGKSHLARELGALLGITPVHLDGLYYDRDWTPLGREQFVALQRGLVTAPRWIIDSNYASTLPIRLHAADTVVFLDLPAWACLPQAPMPAGPSVRVGHGAAVGPAATSAAWIVAQTHYTYLFTSLSGLTPLPTGLRRLMGPPGGFACGYVSAR